MAPLPGVENRVLVADIWEGVLKVVGVRVAEDEGVEEEERMFVRNTGRGTGELAVILLGSRVLLAACFLMVSVSAAAKLSAVVWRDGESELDHEDRAELDSVPEFDDTESLLGERDLGSGPEVSSGLGAGMGGLEARGPVGRSITRSGVVFEVLEAGRGVVLLPQPRLCLSPSLGLLILRLSQRSFLLRKLFPELEVTDLSPTPGVSADDDTGVPGVSWVFLAPAPATQRLLPQLDCLSSTLPDSD